MNPPNVQLPSWMLRLAGTYPAAPATSALHSRIEVRPPQLWPSSLTLRGRLHRLGHRLLNRATPWLPEPARPVNRLALVRTEFLDTLADLDGEPARALQLRIERARSLRELWHLRSSVYGEVAIAHSQPEADRRLAGLNRHFPVRAPRSGLMPLDS